MQQNGLPELDEELLVVEVAHIIDGSSPLQIPLLQHTTVIFPVPEHATEPLQVKLFPCGHARNPKSQLQQYPLELDEELDDVPGQQHLYPEFIQLAGNSSFGM